MALGTVVAFAVVFRTNLGWQRYWEAMTQQHFMYSKWADAYSQFVAFATVTMVQTRAKGGADAAAKVKRVNDIVRRMAKNFSLLSALAADRLTHGDTERMERRIELGVVRNWSKQVVMRGQLRVGKDLTHATRLPGFHAEVPGQPQEDMQNAWDISYVVKEVPNDQELKMLEHSSDRVGVVMYWIIQDLAEISKDIDIAPPIQSRMYQELSNGMLGFNNSLKIADVPFPFPYAQLLTLLLTVFALFIPVYIVVFTKSMFASPILSFIVFQGFWGINEVAKELENPFGTDENDISLADFHARFMDMLSEVEEARGINKWAPETKELRKDTVTVEPSVVGQATAIDGPAPQPPKDLTSVCVVPPEFLPAPLGVLEGTGSASSSPPQNLSGLHIPPTGFATTLHNASRSSAMPPSPRRAEGNSPRPSSPRQQKKAEDAIGNFPGRKLGGTGGGSIDMFDQNLSMIGARMEQHLAQLAKELCVISRLASDGRQQIMQSHEGDGAGAAQLPPDKSQLAHV
eukprot:CAMPEP_0179238862 /NCGR_PEP_ID=MMETSP0797-20121207/15169_1 /TAXON_ID=47934 /ORGANISM="Dinophysis acuminata, Strain DAEP01" /LENGTH=514 /DNA_ID=CAMNT_0020946177 /DNA_START=252 /DNA_END=1796 /DNA_ORIENTATION=+